jgi:hypothetical protein
VKNGIFVKKKGKMKYQDFKELPFGKEIKLKKDSKIPPLLKFRNFHQNHQLNHH